MRNGDKSFLLGPAHDKALLPDRIVILEAWHVGDVHFAQVAESRSIRHVCILAPAQSRDSSDSFYPPTKRSERFKHSPSHCNQGLQQIQRKTIMFTLQPSRPASACRLALHVRACLPRTILESARERKSYETLRSAKARSAEESPSVMPSIAIIALSIAVIVRSTA